MSKILISQSDNFKGNFGEVLRSSAIFYFIKNEHYSTTISFLNYWLIRRELDVAVIISLRDIDGNLVNREKSSFDQGMVFNYKPDCNLTEGSIEVEVFSIENLVIPYAAVMAVYQSVNSVSMVHSYSRTYSPHEIEEKRTITKGHESCWTIKDNPDISSFCVMHNGSVLKEEQECALTLLIHGNIKHEFRLTIPRLPAFSTYRLNLKDHIPGLTSLLAGRCANASLSFELGNSFTRLLVGNQNSRTHELQLTHSNFNYQKHKTDFIDADNPQAYMSLPEQNLKVIIYPDMAQGNYTVRNGDELIKFRHDNRVEYTPKGNLQIFKAESGVLPSRIVTAFSGGLAGKMPFECSLGVFHEKRPPKKMWWGLVGDQRSLKSRLLLTVNEEVYGRYNNEDIFIRLYSARHNRFLSVKTTLYNIKTNDGFIYFTDLFKCATDFLANELGYFTFYSDYPGFFIYSSLENENNSISIEHGF